MNSWTPLWSMIVDSSIWEEEDWVCKIFITLLALKDPDHVVRLTAYNIGKRAKKTEDEILKALKILSSPDKRRIEKQPFEGRRIEKVEDGWLVLNGPKYQEMIQDLKRKKDQAKWQREERLIWKTIRTGEGMNPNAVTPELKARYQRALDKFKSENGTVEIRKSETSMKDMEDRVDNGHIPEGNVEF